MSKHNDDTADRAGKRIEPAPQEPAPVAAPPAPDAAKLHKIPARVTTADLAVTRRAICLQLAICADLDGESLEANGRALASISRLYLTHQRDMRKG